MNDKKERWYIGIGVVVGAFIMIFYDLFQYWLEPVLPQEATPFVKTFSGVIAIVCGLVILKYYFRYPVKKDEK